MLIMFVHGSVQFYSFSIVYIKKLKG